MKGHLFSLNFTLSLSAVQCFPPPFFTEAAVIATHMQVLSLVLPEPTHTLLFSYYWSTNEPALSRSLFMSCPWAVEFSMKLGLKTRSQSPLIKSEKIQPHSDKQHRLNTWHVLPYKMTGVNPAEVLERTEKQEWISVQTSGQQAETNLIWNTEQSLRFKHRFFLNDLQNELSVCFLSLPLTHTHILKSDMIKHILTTSTLMLSFSTAQCTCHLQRVLKNQSSIIRACLYSI